MPATVPNGRLAMCQATVRRNWRVVNRHGFHRRRADHADAGRSEQALEVVAESVELANDLSGDVGLGAGLQRKDRPQGVDAARSRHAAESCSSTSTARATGAMVTHSAGSPRACLPL